MEELMTTIPVFIKYYGELTVFKEYQGILERSSQKGVEVARKPILSTVS